MLKIVPILLTVSLTGTTALVATSSKAADLVAKTGNASTQEESVAIKTLNPEFNQVTSNTESEAQTINSLNPKETPTRVEAGSQPDANPRQPIPCRIFPAPSMMQ